jgi:hypothetical protein
MRRYETDYTGTWRGYCKSRESAIIAAIKHVVNDGYTSCTITDRETSSPVARVRLNGDRTRATVTVLQPFEVL